MHEVAIVAAIEIKIVNRAVPPRSEFPYSQSFQGSSKLLVCSGEINFLRAEIFPLGFPAQKSHEVCCVYVCQAPSLEEGLGDLGSGAERRNKLQKKHPDPSTEFAITVEMKMENRLDQ